MDDEVSPGTRSAVTCADDGTAEDTEDLLWEPITAVLEGDRDNLHPELQRLSLRKPARRVVDVGREQRTDLATNGNHDRTARDVVEFVSHSKLDNFRPDSVYDSEEKELNALEAL